MNGFILVNKPKDYTSRDVVNVISKHFDLPKAGHAGTLDPLATGVLVVGVNNGVKLIDFLTDDTKEYFVEVKLGLLTDTLDITGNKIAEVHDYDVTYDKLEGILNSFIGKNLQEVPKYSAIRVNGKRLYHYARKKEEVILPKREIEIYNINLTSLNKDIFTFKVKVSKGTYIRSLVRDIGEKLNIPCTMVNLCRTKQGEYSLEDCASLNDLDNAKLISMKEALKDYFQVKVDNYLENKILNGRILENRYDKNPVVFVNKNDEVLAIYEKYSKDNNLIKPLKVFK